MEKHEVVIVGAGPAGLKAGELLAKANKDVLIVERKKEKDIGDRICGRYPSNRILGYIPDFLFDFAPTDFKLHLHGMTLSLGFSDGTPFARAIERKELGQYQLKEAKKVGAEIRCEFQVTKVNLKDKKIVTEKGDEYSYDYLIGADGADLIVRKSLGFPINELPVCQYIVKKRVKDIEAFLDWEKLGLGYGWIFPHKDFTYIGVGGFEPLSLEEKHKNFLEMIESWCEKNNIALENEELGKHSINLSYPGFKSDEVFLVGDSAGLTLDPTGEGIYPAIFSGQVAAKAILDPKLDWKDELRELLREEKFFHLILKLLVFAGNTFNAFSISPKKVNKLVSLASVGVNFPIMEDMVIKIAFKKSEKDGKA
jgi:geranylgeranyl reductase